MQSYKNCKAAAQGPQNVRSPNAHGLPRDPIKDYRRQSILRGYGALSGSNPGHQIPSGQMILIIQRGNGICDRCLLIQLINLLSKQPFQNRHKSTKNVVQNVGQKAHQKLGIRSASDHATKAALAMTTWTRS